MQDIILNNFKIATFIRVENKVFSKPFTKLLKKPDLIVLFLHKKNQDIVIKSNLAKIPLINFTSVECLKINVNKNFYDIENFIPKLISISDKSLFFFGLNFLFKRIKKNRSL